MRGIIRWACLFRMMTIWTRFDGWGEDWIARKISGTLGATVAKRMVMVVIVIVIVIVMMMMMI